jgi:hypothetical protein
VTTSVTPFCYYRFMYFVGLLNCGRRRNTNKVLSTFSSAKHMSI